MRKALIAIAVVLLLLVGIVVYAFMNVNQILADNRERLAGMASDAVGREVDFESAEVAFSRGLAVRVQGLEIAEDPRFGEGAFVELESAFIGVRIWPALFGEIEVSGVRLVGPVIHVVSTAEGFNFETIGGEAAEPPPEAEPPPDAGEPLALVIASFEIDEGLVTYEDRTASPPMRLTIDQLESSGSDLSLEGPVALSFSGRLHETGAPTDGTAPMTPFEGRVELADLAAPSGTFRLESPVVYPSIVGAGIVEDPLGDRLNDLDLRVELPAKAEQEGYPVSLASASGRLSDLDYQNLDIAIRYQGNTLDLERVLVDIADGNVSLTGRMELGAEGEPSPFELDLDLRQLDSGQLAAPLLGIAPGLLSGRIGGDLTLAGPSLEWETLQQTLSGALSLEMKEGALENVNLLDTLVDQMVSDPGLGQLVASSIRESAPDALSGNRTEIQNLDLGFQIEDGVLISDDVEMQTGEFALSFAGQVGLGGDVSGEGELALSESLSSQLVRKTDALSALQGESGRVSIPLRIGGTASAMSVRPDLTGLASAAKRELRDKAAGEIADRIFGKRSKKDEASEGEEGAPPSDREAAEGLLKKGLGRLLGE